MGAYDRSYNGGWDMFVAKFDTSLSGTASLVNSTFLGGSSDDGLFDSIVVNAVGEAIVAGKTSSTN